MIIIGTWQWRALAFLAMFSSCPGGCGAKIIILSYFLSWHSLSWVCNRIVRRAKTLFFWQFLIDWINIKLKSSNIWWLAKMHTRAADQPNGPKFSGNLIVPGTHPTWLLPFSAIQNNLKFDWIYVWVFVKFFLKTNKIFQPCIDR